MWLRAYVVILLSTSLVACASVKISPAPTMFFSDEDVAVTLVKTPQESLAMTHTPQTKQESESTPTATRDLEEPAEVTMVSIEPTSVSLTKATATAPASPTLTPVQLPQDKAALQTNDLLFIAGGSLMRWNSANQEIETWLAAEDINEQQLLTNANLNYPGKILNYSTDRQLDKIVLLRSEGITANGVELFDVDLFDVASGETRTIINNSTRLNHLVISPDGNWIAYQVEGENAQIHIVTTSDEASTVEFSVTGDSSRIGDDFEWSPDNRYLAWIDSGGIWLSENGEFQPRPVISNTIAMTYFGGEQTQVDVNFEGIGWSPQGRYILTNVSPSGSEVNWLGIVDTDRGLIAEVPGSFSAGAMMPNASWMSDGRLLTIGSGSGGDGSSPSLNIWQVKPTHAELIMPQSSIFLGASLLEHVMTFPRKLDYRQYAFISTSLDPSGSSKMLIYDNITRELSEVAELPAGILNVTWSADGAGAILQGGHNSAILVTSDEEAFDLYQILGIDSCCFNWLPQE